MMKDCVELKQCIACGGEHLVPVLDLGYQPLANSYKKDPNDPEQMFPLAINRCKDCFHVQLTHQVNPELMFKDYAYVSGTAKTQLEYFDFLVHYILTVFNALPSNVLDIGCNDGSFLDVWKKNNVKTYGVDPAENLHKVSSKEHNVHCGFFTGKEFSNTKFDIITILNAFAHNANQLELLKNAKERLTPDGMIFASISQASMIFNGEFDTIYHEHLSFYNIRSANELCKRAGLHLVDVMEHPIHGNSYIFVISQYPVDNNRIEAMIGNEREFHLYDDKLYEKYSDSANLTAQYFALTIRTMRKAGMTIVGYGAPAKGNTLMNFAKEMPDFIIDDNPLKQNLYTPGMGCPIKNSQYLIDNYSDKDDILFIPLAWNFFDEIVGKIKELRPDKNDTFFRYFPKLEVTKNV